MFEFTRNELRDLVIAFIVLSISFAISNVRFDVHGFISILPIVMFGVGVGFLLHELGHKYVAMKYGCEAEFKLWPLGLLIAFLTSLLPFGFVFASPGEAKINADNLTDEIMGKISIAGPMANMGLALIFLAIAALALPFKFHSSFFNLVFLICTVGFSVNSFLAAFNLLPIYSLDGTKVLKWSIGIWIAVFVIALFMMLVSMTIGAENMVAMLIS